MDLGREYRNVLSMLGFRLLTTRACKWNHFFVSFTSQEARYRNVGSLVDLDQLGQLGVLEIPKL